MKNFTDIAFTKGVKSVQEQMGSRKNYARMEQHPAPVQLGDSEINFIENCETFYLATVGTNGWPYVQHRGGPKGFLKFIGKDKLMFPDFRGNRQYISTGNLNENNKVALIIVDYARRARLKIWATCSCISFSEAQMKYGLEDYSVVVERVMILQVEATDWNCPKYIKPRFTEEEINEYFVK